MGSGASGQRAWEKGGFGCVAGELEEKLHEALLSAPVIGTQWAEGWGAHSVQPCLAEISQRLWFSHRLDLVIPVFNLQGQGEPQL